MAKKRRDTIQKYKSFLEFLNSHHFNKDKNQRSVSNLKSAGQFKPYNEQIIKDLLEEECIKQDEDTFRITLKGYEYLENLRSRGYKERQEKINKFMLIATFVIASSAFLSNYLKYPNPPSIFPIFYIGLGIIIIYLVFMIFFKT